MERNNDDEQTTRKKESMSGGPEPPSLADVESLEPTFLFARMTPMTDVISQRSATFMPPMSLAFSSSAPTDETETVKTTTTQFEEKKKSFPISKEHVREEFNHLFEKHEKTQTNKTFWGEPKKPTKPPSWNKPFLNKVPKHFPLEVTNVSVKMEECGFTELVTRLSNSFRDMSIQAKFFDRPAAVALLTPENVELYLTLWESDSGKEVIVDVMRRRGDTLIFHQYAHHILDAASGKFDPSAFSNDEGSLLYLKAAEKKLKAELSRVVPEKDMEKESVVALELLLDLCKKDRRDARRLGMEGLAILANARKTVLRAAILTSRVLLLDDQSITSPGLHEILLGVIQKRSIGESEELWEHPVVDDDDDDENFFEDDDDALKNYSPEYKEEMSLLFNLALDALAHALEVATTFDISLIPTVSTVSAQEVVDMFLVRTCLSTESDLLTTLLHTLQRAHVKPHNAWLAAKCLRYICAASPDAAQRTCKLGGLQVLGEAYDVGVASHAKLESECALLQGVLSNWD